MTEGEHSGEIRVTIFFDYEFNRQVGHLHPMQVDGRTFTYYI